MRVLEWDQRRDYFTATLIAMNASSETRTYTAEEILLHRYPRLRESVTVTVDPDTGAAGDWRALRSSLKGKGA